MFKKSVAILSCLALFVAMPALAHVVVKPNQVGVGTFQTFTMGVPVEKEMPTTALRLVLPEGLQHVMPNVKPGWKIEVKENEISWTGGSIPSGLRDEFLFSAQAPAQEAKLVWKAYQTYQDGTTVAWDQDGTSTPFSVTKVVNDIQASSTKAANFSDQHALLFSLLAIALSVVALIAALRKR